ncbi:tau-tubulin kinase 1 [Anaeramoeba ignava]|uniref:Tau-tubulin kinase 1 n=1 Tax=Anaeramoeba ignava TaxID=1746090 RepID=A0A9Q0LK87_ANAIG|nr:tau-tubulin kinase 1 [Anaeramoeba ignava]
MEFSSQPLNDRWCFLKRIGKGSFGEIYSAYDMVLQENVAIKIEPISKDEKRLSLLLEISILKKLQGCPYATQFIHCGKNLHYRFLIMELLGKNLSQLLKEQTFHQFSLLTTIKLGIQMISAIEYVHKIGFVHRDIKPSNFAIRKNVQNQPDKELCCILDFGLAKRFLEKDGKYRPPRLGVGFRGTARYASLSAHQKQDLSRKDDLISLYYSLIEFLKGSLPWSHLKDRDEIMKLKIRYNNLELCQGLPPEFTQFFLHLQSLGYSDEPNYKYLRSLLRNISVREGFGNGKYDWEIQEEQMMSIHTDSKETSDSGNQIKIYKMETDSNGQINLKEFVTSFKNEKERKKKEK